MNDPYRILDVARDADSETIKQAYHKLAKKHHPDRNPGDLETERRFKDITQAYQLLSDPKARRDFDRGSGDASGRTTRKPFDRTTAGPREPGDWSQRLGKGLDRLIGYLGLTRSGQPWRGDNDQRHRLEVDFLTAVLGGKQRMSLLDGRMLEIDIPPGTEDDTRLRLKGQGQKGPGGKHGDLLLHIKVRTHPLFTRQGHDLYLDLPISLKEALLGVRLRTPTVDGSVFLTIPAGANSGQVFRLRGKGVADRAGKRGDQYVRLMVMLPKAPSAAMAVDLERLASHDDRDDVRAHFKDD